MFLVRATLGVSQECDADNEEAMFARKEGTARRLAQVPNRHFHYHSMHIRGHYNEYTIPKAEQFSYPELLIAYVDSGASWIVAQKLEQAHSLSLCLFHACVSTSAGFPVDQATVRFKSDPSAISQTSSRSQHTQTSSQSQRQNTQTSTQSQAIQRPMKRAAAQKPTLDMAAFRSELRCWMEPIRSLP